MPSAKKSNILSRMIAVAKAGASRAEPLNAASTQSGTAHV
jgi:hypothetical protein